MLADHNDTFCLHKSTSTFGVLHPLGMEFITSEDLSRVNKVVLMEELFRKGSNAGENKVETPSLPHKPYLSYDDNDALFTKSRALFCVVIVQSSSTSIHTYSPPDLLHSNTTCPKPSAKPSAMTTNTLTGFIRRSSQAQQTQTKPSGATRSSGHLRVMPSVRN